MSLKLRHRAAEEMDQPGLDESLHRQALSGLRRVNRISRSGGILWPAIRDLACKIDEPLRILDIACGGGDVAMEIARRANRSGIEADVDGCDKSPVAVRFSRQQAEKANIDNMSFFELDVKRDSLPEGYHVIICSLFLHHLEESDAVDLLRAMAGAARHLVLVNDLRRSRLGYGLAWVGCRLLSRSRIVHVDGPLSVAAAFTIEEALELARQSGIEGAKISRHWPQRFLLSWSRT